MADAVPPNESRPGSLVVGIVVPLFWTPAAVVGLGVAMMSVMIFASPGSTESPLTVGFFVSVVSFPALSFLTAICVPIVAFLAARAPDTKGYRNRLGIAVGLSLLPLVSVILGVMFMLLIGVVCDGDFAC